MLQLAGCDWIWRPGLTTAPPLGRRTNYSALVYVRHQVARSKRPHHYHRDQKSYKFLVLSFSVVE